MDEPIENQYFDWLCAKVMVENPPNYVELFRILHTHSFHDLTGLDENRIEDAKELRVFFLSEHFLPEDQTWLSQDCSVFEVLVAFAERANFQIALGVQGWFWQFITNLRLEDFRRASVTDRAHIHEILEQFVLRNYEPNGDGGLFPLRRPHRDQREVEIWYQFCDYVDDNGLLYELV